MVCGYLRKTALVRSPILANLFLANPILANPCLANPFLCCCCCVVCCCVVCCCVVCCCCVVLCCVVLCCVVLCCVVLCWVGLCVLWVREWRLVGQGLHHTSFTCTIHTSLTAPAHLLFVFCCLFLVSCIDLDVVFADMGSV